jgi:hypothetical protein
MEHLRGNNLNHLNNETKFIIHSANFRTETLGSDSPIGNFKLVPLYVTEGNKKSPLLTE